MKQVWAICRMLDLSIVARCRYVTAPPPSLHPPPVTPNFPLGREWSAESSLLPSFLPLIVRAAGCVTSVYSVSVLWLPNHRELSGPTECSVNNLMTIMVAAEVGPADLTEKPTTTRPLLWTNSLPRKNRRSPGEFGFYERTESCYVSL